MVAAAFLPTVDGLADVRNHARIQISPIKPYGFPQAAPPDVVQELRPPSVAVCKWPAAATATGLATAGDLPAAKATAVFVRVGLSRPS